MRGGRTVIPVTGRTDFALRCALTSLQNRRSHMEPLLGINPAVSRR